MQTPNLKTLHPKPQPLMRTCGWQGRGAEAIATLRPRPAPEARSQAGPPHPHHRAPFGSVWRFCSATDAATSPRGPFSYLRVPLSYLRATRAVASRLAARPRLVPASPKFVLDTSMCIINCDSVSDAGGSAAGLSPGRGRARGGAVAALRGARGGGGRGAPARAIGRG